MPRTTTQVDLDRLLLGLAVPRASDDTEGQVLAAAVTELLKHGLDGFEVDDVAARSGVGRSTIYRRFGDRNGLIAATLASEARRFFAALADSVRDLDDIEDQVVAAFSAGLRLARDHGLVDLVRSEPLLLRLLTVDAGDVIAAAVDQLVAEARRRVPQLEARSAATTAELLVRLAISFVITPSDAFAGDHAAIEGAVRRHVVPLIRTR